MGHSNRILSVWLPCAMQGSRICHQGWQGGLGQAQPGRRQDDACETWLEDAFRSSVGCCLVGQPTATCKPAERRAASHRAISKQKGSPFPAFSPLPWPTFSSSCSESHTFPANSPASAAGSGSDRNNVDFAVPLKNQRETIGNALDACLRTSLCHAHVCCDPPPGHFQVSPPVSPRADDKTL